MPPTFDLGSKKKPAIRYFKFGMCLQNCILRGYREIITRNQTNRETYVQVKGVRLKKTELISIPQRSNGEGGMFLSSLSFRYSETLTFKY